MKLNKYMYWLPYIHQIYLSSIHSLPSYQRYIIYIYLQKKLSEHFQWHTSLLPSPSPSSSSPSPSSSSSPSLLLTSLFASSRIEVNIEIYFWKVLGWWPVLQVSSSRFSKMDLFLKISLRISVQRVHFCGVQCLQVTETFEGKIETTSQQEYSNVERSQKKLSFSLQKYSQF